MKLNRSFIQALGVLAVSVLITLSAKANQTPNIVYILADDMGYGDVAFLNKGSLIPTPNIDRIGREGIHFTDAHSGSAVCTPTRYGILTGRYSWRTHLKRGVLYGYGRHLIEPSRVTVASLLKARGYNTACIGKWHLGMDMPATDGLPMGHDAPNLNTLQYIGNVDWRGRIENGPNALGFDYFFGISASLDMHPYIYIENDRFVGEATAMKDFMPEWSRMGPAEPDLEAVDILPDFTSKTVSFIEKQTSAKPFFVYMPLAAPHTPIVPSEEYQGVSGVTPYADFTMQVDATVGAVLDTLDRKGFTENTIVIFTADNGCSPTPGRKLLAKGHRSSHIFRGFKADVFEGGHRIPFLAKWPGRIEAGSASHQTICLTDLLATCASITSATLPENAGEDSYNILPALLGEGAGGPIREATVHHSANGTFAIRRGPWKLILAGGSGGWSQPTPAEAQAQNLPPVQLYNLEADIAETTNLYQERSDIVAELTRLLDKYKTDTRSAPIIRRQ